jgi:hypothetical protein
MPSLSTSVASKPHWSPAAAAPCGGRPRRTAARPWPTTRGRSPRGCPTPSSPRRACLKSSVRHPCAAPPGVAGLPGNLDALDEARALHVADDAALRPGRPAGTRPRPGRSRTGRCRCRSCPGSSSSSDCCTAAARRRSCRSPREREADADVAHVGDAVDRAVVRLVDQQHAGRSGTGSMPLRMPSALGLVRPASSLCRRGRRSRRRSRPARVVELSGRRARPAPRSCRREAPAGDAAAEQAPEGDRPDPPTRPPARSSRSTAPRAPRRACCRSRSCSRPRRRARGTGRRPGRRAAGHVRPRGHRDPHLAALDGVEVEPSRPARRPCSRTPAGRSENVGEAGEAGVGARAQLPADLEVGAQAALDRRRRRVVEDGVGHERPARDHQRLDDERGPPSRRRRRRRRRAASISASHTEVGDRRASSASALKG